MQKGLLASILLAVVVIGLGAFTRLTDAGLGCPDWPGCYGFLSVPQQEAHIEQAEAAFPERPFEAGKAWAEMVHRYFAGSLGLLVLGLTIAAWRVKRQRALATLASAVIVFQAILGMWTVTLGLMPLVVMGHLLGGFSMLALLFTWYMLERRAITANSRGSQWLWLGMLILVVQIALGGWTSANYAAVSCQGLPLCHEPWQELYQVSAFDPLPGTERADYEFGVLSHEQRVTIHVTHRIWAVVTALYWLILALSQIQRRHSEMQRGRASRLIFVLLMQVALGAGNVVWNLPLSVAVAHNLMAAMLLLSAISVLLAHYQAPSTRSSLKSNNKEEVAHGKIQRADPATAA